VELGLLAIAERKYADAEAVSGSSVHGVQTIFNLWRA
jgi:hypothetical protein